MSDDFFHATELFLSCSDNLKESDLYKYDAIEFASYYLCAKADLLYVKALEKKQMGAKNEANKLLEKVVALLQQADKLLLSHPLHRLDRWVEQARNCGQSVVEKDFYEANAKRLITTWGGIQEDYAARTWSGLIKDYYIPRLQLYFSDKKKDDWEEKWITTPWHNTTEPFQEPLDEAVKLVRDAVLHAVESKSEFNQKALDDAIKQFEDQWVSSNKKVERKVEGDLMNYAHFLLDKYKTRLE